MEREIRERKERIAENTRKRKEWEKEHQKEWEASLRKQAAKENKEPTEDLAEDEIIWMDTMGDAIDWR